MPTLRLGIVALLLAAAGCATTSQIERRFDEGRYGEVARLFDSDSQSWSHEADVYRAIIARALPGSPAYAPERARSYMRGYMQRFPDGAHATQVRNLSQLVDRVLRLDAAGAACDARGQRLADRAAVLQARVDSLMQVAAAQSGQIDSLRTAARAEARQRDIVIRGLQDELDRLKAIDLGAPPRGAPHTLPGDSAPRRPAADSAGART